MENLQNLLEQGKNNLISPENSRLQIKFNTLVDLQDRRGYIDQIWCDCMSGKISIKTALYMIRVAKRGENSLYATYLTDGGNLLREFELGWYFQSPGGKFIREVSNSEAEYLREKCLKIKISKPHPHPEFLPTWNFVKRIQVNQDNSNYRWQTSSNGGNYSFKTYHDWFVAKYPNGEWKSNGEWKFAFIERHSTSADFGFDELKGTFQSDLGLVYISNGVDCPRYSSQDGIEWVDGEKFSSVGEVLEKTGIISSFDEMWKEMYEYIPFQGEEDEDGYVCSALSFTDKKGIISRLEEIYKLVYAEELERDEIIKFEEIHRHFKRSRKGQKRTRR